MERITPISEARANLSSLIDETKKTRQHCILTRNGKAAAILMSPEELETFRTGDYRILYLTVIKRVIRGFPD
jgi:prevent-host-death family protein